MVTLPIRVVVDVRLDPRTRQTLDRFERKLDRLLEGVQHMTTQNDEVRAIVDSLGGDVSSLRSSLAGVSGDVAYLKAKLDELPAGQPIDEATLADLRSTAAAVNEVTTAFASLDAGTVPETPAEPGTPDPVPPTPGDPTE